MAVETTAEVGVAVEVASGNDTLWITLEPKNIDRFLNDAFLRELMYHVRVYGLLGLFSASVSGALTID